MRSRIEAALSAAKLVGKVFPIKPSAKYPPLLNGWPQKATSDPEVIASYWLPVPDANIGIHCENLLVIDVDVKKGGLDSLELLRLIDGLPDTLTSNTPTGGKHLFFALPVGHAGVPNSVSVLGTGLDVRSTGGYVLAPGSHTEAGTYEWEHPGVAIAPAPEWLILRLGTQSPKTGTIIPVPDAPSVAKAAAEAWLAAQAPATEGEGGDARTYAVACGLRDRGVSQAQALDLMQDWNARCVPPWEPSALSVKVRNAYNYGQNAPAAKVALPADFPVVEKPTPPPARPGAIPLAVFAGQEARGAGYVVKGMLQRRSYASIYGAPGEGKTFIALDLAYHVAAGREWHGHKVHAGPTLYLAYEGTGGFVKRARAVCQHYGEANVPLYIASASFNLRELPGRAALGEMIATLPAKPVLVVVDTFARALTGGDENSAQDVGAFNAAVAALIESTGACVLIVHHSGKDKSKGARGSSALLAALDTEIEIGEGVIAARKQRDVEVRQPIGFKLTPIVVGIDTDGEELSSCVVVAEAIDPMPKSRITGNARRGLEILEEISPGNEPVLVDKWRDACASFLGRNVRQSFHDLKKKLLERNYIVVTEGHATRRTT
jgi:hypothetical protein